MCFNDCKHLNAHICNQRDRNSLYTPVHMLPCACFRQCWQLRAAVKSSGCDCSGCRDYDEAAFVLGVNNQLSSEVMETKEGERGGLCIRGPAYKCVGEVGWGDGTQLPRNQHSLELRA